MQSTIRPARPADADQLRRLQSLLSEPAPALLSAAIPAERMPADTPPVAGDDPLSATAAFTLLVTLDKQDTPVGYLLAVEGSGTHIAELVVEPDHRRMGRGGALLEAIVDRGSAPLTVHVAADNSAARRLYERVGFTAVARSADRFEHDDAITLRYTPETA